MIRDAISCACIFWMFWAVLTMTAALEPCPTEDATNCYWDAQAQGNGQGRDFWDIYGIAIQFPG